METDDRSVFFRWYFHFASFSRRPLSREWVGTSVAFQLSTGPGCTHGSVVKVEK